MNGKYLLRASVHNDPTAPAPVPFFQREAFDKSSWNVRKNFCDSRLSQVQPCTRKVTMWYKLVHAWPIGGSVRAYHLGSVTIYLLITSTRATLPTRFESRIDSGSEASICVDRVSNCRIYCSCRKRKLSRPQINVASMGQSVRLVRSPFGCEFKFNYAYAIHLSQYMEGNKQACQSQA